MCYLVIYDSPVTSLEIILLSPENIQGFPKSDRAKYIIQSYEIYLFETFLGQCSQSAEHPLFINIL